MKFHETTLPNGLRVVAELNDRAHSVAAGFFVRAGSRDETAAESGVSHFLEHMAFKGSATRDAIAVNRELDRIGAKHNAQTSEEDTIYHVTSLPEYFPRAFDVLGDILRPVLRAEDFETEKQVILEEIQMYLDNPMSVAYEAAKAAHFGPHPLGQSILGSPESITALTVDQMRSYFERRYSPPNIVLAVAGKTSWEQVVELAESHCGAWSGAPAGRTALPPHGQAAFEALLREEDRQQTLLAVSDGPPLESEDRYAASLLATIVGDHSGSRLYWTLIDPGYADGVELSYQDYNRGGAFYTVVSCEPEEAQSNLERVARTYRQIQAKGPTPEELSQAQNKVLARAVLRSERPMGRLMSLGFHWMYRGEYRDIQAELDAYQAVTVDDLKRVLADWPLTPMTIVSVGPTTDVHKPG